MRRQLELVQSPAREVKGESPAPAFYKAPADLDTPLDLENARTDLSTVGLLVERDPDPRSPVENGYLFPSAPRAAVKAFEPEHLYTTVPPDLVPLIPSPELSTFLIRRALYLVGWMHVAVHKPTFTKKHEAWQAERAAGDQTSVFLGLDWLALYFAFLAVGFFCFTRAYWPALMHRMHSSAPSLSRMTTLRQCKQVFRLVRTFSD